VLHDLFGLLMLKNASYLRALKIFAGPLAGLLVWYAMLSSTGNQLMAKMSGLTVLMAVWWIFESFSLYFTALLPLPFFPLLGIMDMRDLAPLYTNEVIFLFIGGFLIAFAIEKWNLHKRIALKIILMVGQSPSRVLLGFMLSGYLLSMWISNVATTMMLLPAVLAVAKQYASVFGDENCKKIKVALLLGLAYSSSIGGTATLIGTAPNIIFVGFYGQSFPDTAAISFSDWLLFGLPLSIVFLMLCYAVLLKMFQLKLLNQFKSDKNIDWKSMYHNLGKLSSEEKLVIIIFISTVLLWFFRADLDIGFIHVPGWIHFFSFPEYITDSTVAILMACALFVIPTSDFKGSIIGWDDAKRIPLGILFLFGGGFALAKGISVSGLSDWMAIHLEGISHLNLLLIVVLLSTFMTFFTELTSNTASTYLVLPILLSLSASLDVNPILVMLPVVFSASFAFMLPIATPPNTIVFGTEAIKMSEMLKTGFILNVIGIVLISLFTLTVGRWLF
jgi:solute carrier family 13 (sodium-dependent dicarboxylate transporter), member 2/3/5